MNNEDIKILISLESLHRKVFDTIYVQGYNLTKDDKITLYRYYILCQKYPTFRNDLSEAFIGFTELESAFKRLGRTLNDEETEILHLLNQINFSRYSISDEAKNKIRELRKNKKDELED
jgi:hypothetical protein